MSSTAPVPRASLFTPRLQHSTGHSSRLRTVFTTIPYTSGTTTGNLIGIDGRLDPLTGNGGPTTTRMPFPDSPVIDAGNPATPGSGGNACLNVDQRGVSRPFDGNGNGVARCDMGSVEF